MPYLLLFYRLCPYPYNLHILISAFIENRPCCILFIFLSETAVHLFCKQTYGSSWHGTFVLYNHNPEHLISISTVGSYNLSSLFRVQLYTAGHRIKIRLIRRLTKDQDQTLISISTLIQQFPPWVYPPWSQIVHINLKLELLKPKIQWILRKGLQWVLYRVYRTILECP